MKDYYKILDLKRSATDREIKKAYNRLAMKYHPDRNAGDKKAEEKFKNVQEAGEVLKDSGNRKKYDQFGSNWKHADQMRQQQRQQQQWQHQAGGMGGGGDAFFRDERDYSDFFYQFFGGGKRGQGRSAKARNYEAVLGVNLNDVYRGNEIVFNLEGKSLKIKLYPGIKDGTKLKLTGKGAAASRGGVAGDLYLSIKLEEHPFFERKGDHLYAEEKVNVYTLILGGSAEIHTMGRPVKIKIAPGTQTGKIIRLSGKGMPVPKKADAKGDLFITIGASIPTALSEEQLKLVEQLRGLES